MTHRDRSGAPDSVPPATPVEPSFEDVPCAPCVARLHSPAERLLDLQKAIGRETDPLVTVTHLLHLCRDEHRVLWEQAADPAIRAVVAKALVPVRAVAASRSAEAAVDAPMRRVLADTLVPVEGVAPVVIAHALAQVLDEHYGRFLTDSFRRRSPYQPGVGDPVPLGGPDIRALMDMQPTAPPWRLANRLDETRRIRLAGSWATQFRILFDYSLFETLSGVITVDTLIATCHPNRALSEFALPRDPDKPAFPVRPKDLARQKLLLDHLIGRAVDAGAAIVVLPELCVTASLSRQLQQWVHRERGPHLVVAGSYHHTGGSPARRRNTAIAWVRGHDGPLTHDKHSPAGAPLTEDIRPQGWPELRVYVTAEGWHLVVAICRDLLNPQAVHALTEAGANLVLVPAMSESLTPFTGQIAHLVGSAQALVVVANNPAEWTDMRTEAVHRPARALFGHPGLGQQTRLVVSSDSAPGIATLQVRSGSIGWASAYPPEAADSVVGHSPPTSEALPRWVGSLAETLRRRYPQPRPYPPQSLTFRYAAVLVLLTAGPTGPRLLLTERAADLRDYPGRLTFPGGAQDPQDTDPTATALREAAEEVGLNPASVHLLGVLPALTDPDGRFLVTPVLAWSARPEYTRPVNVAEVASVRQAALTDLAASRDRVSATPGADEAPDGPMPEVFDLGAMTATVIDMLVALCPDEAPSSASGSR